MPHFRSPPSSPVFSSSTKKRGKSLSGLTVVFFPCADPRHCPKPSKSLNRSRSPAAKSDFSRVQLTTNKRGHVIVKF
ncbi:hypothetical protein MRB53_033035 [Persea americana]|uniref:Uncharacterized protein n=1 Tax=Persea americana TaxID=3435 RepID=A0ACC2KTW3_PERAE|nr:hypothetical protein MRB53_033035 [Persea americana]